MEVICKVEGEGKWRCCFEPCTKLFKVRALPYIQEDFNVNFILIRCALYTLQCLIFTLNLFISFSPIFVSFSSPYPSSPPLLSSILFPSLSFTSLPFHSPPLLQGFDYLRKHLQVKHDGFAAELLLQDAEPFMRARYEAEDIASRPLPPIEVCTYVCVRERMGVFVFVCV